MQTWLLLFALAGALSLGCSSAGTVDSSAPDTVGGSAQGGTGQAGQGQAGSTGTDGGAGSGGSVTAGQGGQAPGGAAGHAGSAAGGKAAGGAGGKAGGASGGGGSTGPACGQNCVSSTDCGPGQSCVQLEAAQDSYCAGPCSATDTCAGGLACVTLSTVEGDQVDGCVVAACAGSSTDNDGGAGGVAGTGGKGTAGMAQGGAGGAAGMCGALAAPDTTASCGACKSSGKPCQTNGCFGGWWCNTSTSKCQAPPSPSACGGQGGSGQGGSGQAGSGQAGSGQAGSQGSIGPSGGTLSTLRFAVVGDTRPPVINDTKGYPTAIISKIWEDVAALDPPFAVMTGDYLFSSPNGGQAAPQLDLYLNARKAFPHIAFPALGNHECTGATDSNCGPAGKDGETDNYKQFMGKMLGPIGQSLPYYVIPITGSGGWTAKVVVTAMNAWDAQQEAWLDQTLAQPTTYTFVVRHESWTVSAAPGVSSCNQLISQHPLTLLIVGHAHTYTHSPKNREIIVGNGGAPLVGSVNYGFVMVSQRPSQDIQIDLHDYATGAIADTFAIHADGSSAP